MSGPERRLVLVDFDHAPLDEHRTLVRVLAQPGSSAADASGAQLLISRADAPWLSFPARVWEHDRAGVWHGVFAVPSAVVSRPEFGFALVVAGETTALPHPGFQTLAAPAAAVVLAPPAAVPGLIPAAGRLSGAGLRTRALALATVVAVTASSSPGLAVAGSVIGASPAHASREHIEHLGLFAVERARATAVRRALQATSHSARSGHPARNGRTKSPAVTPVQASSPTGGLSPRTPAHCATPKPTPARVRARRITAATLTPKCAALGPTTVRAAVPTPTAAPTTTETTTTAAPTTTSETTTTPATTTAPAAGPASPATTVPTTTTTSTTTTSATTAPAVTPVTSGGVPLGPGSSPSLSPVPQRLASAPPRPARSTKQRTSHPQLPVSLPRGTHRATGAVGLSTPGAPTAARGAGSTSLTATPPGFTGPKSWTGSVVANPALEGVLGNLSAQLRDAGAPPRFLIPIYMEAARRYGIPWQVLAAINSVETDYGRNLKTSFAGAIGWMQFEPSTWKQWGVAVDGHNVANPYDPRDAIFSAARYLQAAGGDTDLTKGIYAYNHAGWYVDMVMARARAIAVAVQPHVQTNRRGVVSTFFTQGQGHWAQGFRGGYLTHYTRLVSAANMVSAADFPYSWGGGHEQPARFAPFDCSGSVSYVLQQAGYTVPTSVSGGIPRWRFPAGPGRVTIFYNTTHTFMRIGNRYFGTSTSRPGGGAGWISTDKLPSSYLANFSEVHVPKLGDNAFAPPSRHHTRGHRTASRRGSTSALRASSGSAQTPSIPSQLTKLPSYGAEMMLAFRGV